jgi:hypothetical protein
LGCIGGAGVDPFQGATINLLQCRFQLVVKLIDERIVSWDHCWIENAVGFFKNTEQQQHEYTSEFSIFKVEV